MKYKLNDCTFPFLPPNEDPDKAVLVFIENILEKGPYRLMSYILQCILKDLLLLF